MEKRISSRGIIIDDNSVISMFRRKISDDGAIREYYVIPGGGLEANETLEETVIREIKEELSVDVRVLGFIGTEEKEHAIDNYFYCEIVSGVPQLGGPELEKSCPENYYEIKKVKINALDEIDILGKNMILKAVRGEYEQKDS